jgi:hypothetical protein
MGHMKYEYLVVAETWAQDIAPHILASTLDQNGEEGWELVAVLPPVQEMKDHGKSFVYFFKRPKK